VLNLIFVTVTIAQSGIQAHKYKIWKSSSLSTLLMLREDLHMQDGGLRSLSENEDILRATKASLERKEDGEWRLQGPGDEP
jgi:hypothetical protein